MSRWAALAVALAGLAVSFQHASAQLAQRKLLTLAAAQKMVAAARAEAERRHLAGVIAVVDDGGWPILILRMDNSADIASVELAPGKARTTAFFKKPSGAQEQTINNGRIAAVAARDFIEMQGGFPIVADGQVRRHRGEFRHPGAGSGDRRGWSRGLHSLGPDQRMPYDGSVDPQTDGRERFERTLFMSPANAGAALSETGRVDPWRSPVAA